MNTFLRPALRALAAGHPEDALPLLWAVKYLDAKQPPQLAAAIAAIQGRDIGAAINHLRAAIALNER